MVVGCGVCMSYVSYFFFERVLMGLGWQAGLAFVSPKHIRTGGQVLLKMRAHLDQASNIAGGIVGT